MWSDSSIWAEKYVAIFLWHIASYSCVAVFTQSFSLLLPPCVPHSAFLCPLLQIMTFKLKIILHKYRILKFIVHLWWTLYYFLHGCPSVDHWEAGWESYYKAVHKYPISKHGLLHLQIYYWESPLSLAVRNTNQTSKSQLSYYHDF